MTAPIGPGDLFTVEPHTLPHGVDCGRWHCIALTSPNPASGLVMVAEIVEDPTAQPDHDLQGPAAPSGWRRRMMTCVHPDRLRPLEVQVDLFGSPATVGGAR